MIKDDMYWIVMHQIEELKELLDERDKNYLNNKGSPLSSDYTERVENRAEALHSSITIWRNMSTYKKSF